MGILPAVLQKKSKPVIGHCGRHPASVRLVWLSGNTADANILGQVIGQAVQAQLIKEKRAGGLLTR